MPRVLLTAVLALLAPVAFAASTVQNGVFTDEQAKRGKEVYLAHCATACHQPNLVGSGPAPDLAGADFLARWEDLSLADLHKKIRTTMPMIKPGSLAPDDYLAVMAYLLEANGFPAGSSGLTADAAALGAITIVKK